MDTTAEVKTGSSRHYFYRKATQQPDQATSPSNILLNGLESANAFEKRVNDFINKSSLQSSFERMRKDATNDLIRRKADRKARKEKEEHAHNQSITPPEKADIPSTTRDKAATKPITPATSLTDVTAAETEVAKKSPELFEKLNILSPTEQNAWLSNIHDDAMLMNPHQWLKLASLFNVNSKASRQPSLLDIASLDVILEDRAIDKSQVRPLENFLELRDIQNRNYARDAVAEGVKFIKLNRIKEAMEFYKRALDMDPKYADGWFHVAEGLVQQRKLSEAADHLERVLRLDATHEGAKALLASIRRTTQPKKVEKGDEWDIVDEHGESISKKIEDKPKPKKHNVASDDSDNESVSRKKKKRSARRSRSREDDSSRRQRRDAKRRHRSRDRSVTRRSRRRSKSPRESSRDDKRHRTREDDRHRRRSKSPRGRDSSRQDRRARDDSHDDRRTRDDSRAKRYRETSRHHHRSKESSRSPSRGHKYKRDSKLDQKEELGSDEKQDFIDATRKRQERHDSKSEKRQVHRSRSPTRRSRRRRSSSPRRRRSNSPRRTRRRDSISPRRKDDKRKSSLSPRKRDDVKRRRPDSPHKRDDEHKRSASIKDDRHKLEEKRSVPSTPKEDNKKMTTSKNDDKEFTALKQDNKEVTTLKEKGSITAKQDNNEVSSSKHDIKEDTSLKRDNKESTTSKDNIKEIKAPEIENASSVDKANPPSTSATENKKADTKNTSVLKANNEKSDK